MTVTVPLKMSKYFTNEETFYEDDLLPFFYFEPLNTYSHIQLFCNHCYINAFYDNLNCLLVIPPVY